MHVIAAKAVCFKEVLSDEFREYGKNVVENANIVYNNIAVHPLTGRVYLNNIKAYGWDFLINNISVFKPEGDALALEVNYEDHTHFPAGIFFPANFE